MVGVDVGGFDINPDGERGSSGCAEKGALLVVLLKGWCDRPG
jgi:hypothetical protein